MKGLARSAPALQLIKINSRSARKHYGAEISTRFDSGIDPIRKRFQSIISGNRSETDTTMIEHGTILLANKM